MLTPQEIQKLIEVAKESRKNAFAFLTDSAKGAAVLTRDGQYFGGCNTECFISGLGVCAERSAVDHAVVHGDCEIKAVAVIYDRLILPCGACLQYLMQFYQITDEDITIISADTAGNHKTYSLHQLLPEGYLSKTYDQKLKGYQKTRQTS